MSSYIGRQKIPKVIVKSNMTEYAPILTEYTENTVSRSAIGTSTATASITLPSVPKWYKCYACGYSNVMYGTNLTWKYDRAFDIANKVQDDLVEITPTITNEGKTFSSSKSVTISGTGFYGIAVQVMVLLYIL